MAMYPTNTRLEDWLTIWLVDEVDSILLSQNKIKYVGEFVGMPKANRVNRGLPHNRDTCTDYIRKYRPNAGAQAL
jgi:hypothetical protein